MQATMTSLKDTCVKFADIQLGLGRKFEVTDLDSIMLHQAEDFSTAYEGTFDYMLQMRGVMIKWGRLTAGQAKGVANCMAADGRRIANPKPDPKPLVEYTLATVPVGTYTMVLDEETGDRLTMKIERLNSEKIAKYNKAEGTSIIQVMTGPDNETSYTGFGWVTPEGKLFTWKSAATKFTEEKWDTIEIAAQVLLTADPNTAKGMGLAYAIESGRCFRCNHKLTVPASIYQGLGPECATKIAF